MAIHKRKLPELPNLPRAERTTWTYFVSRDSINGEPSGMCTLWYIKPIRSKQRYRVTWVAAGHPESGCLGEYRVDEVRAWFRTIPDTDLELLKVEQFASPKMIADAEATAKARKKA